MFSVGCDKQEDWGPVSRDRDFDFTLCFEEGVILPSTFAVLLVVGWVQIAVDFTTKVSRLPLSRKSQLVLIEKLILLLIASIFSLASLVIGSVIPESSHWSFSTSLLSVLALLTTVSLTYANHTRTTRSSTILLLFWPLYTVSLLIWIRSTLTAGLLLKDDIVVWLQCAATAFGLIAFAMELQGTEFGSSGNSNEIVKEINQSPYVTANVFGRWSFGWMTPLMRLGRKKYLTEEDMFDLLPSDEAEHLGNELYAAMQKHSSLWVAMFTAYGRPFAFALLLKFIQDSLAFLQPQLLRLLLSYITRYQAARETNPDGPWPSPYEGFGIAFCMFLAAMCQTTLLHQYFQRVFESGMRVRAGLVTNIYRKSLVLSSDERGARASGDIVNLMSVDTVRLQDLCTYGLIILSGPYQIVLAFISLYKLLGWPAFVGVAIMILSIPMNTVVAKHLKKLQQAQMKNRDQRTRLMTELLSNIKSIKLYGWEPAFIQKILRIRNDQELRMLRKIGVTVALNNTLWQLIPILVALSSFLVAAVASDKPLTSDIIFPALSLFMLLQFPMAMFANITTSVIEATVSVKRLSGFLRASELEPDARKVEIKPRLELGDEVLQIKNGEFEWTKDQQQSTLHGIDLVVRKGELVGVLGRVGSGKSSLLSAIIGEMRRVDGEVMVNGTVAYCPQTPWIMSATVRDNILFSHAYDAEFYELVLDACALRPDLTLLAEGDMTLVGEKGITLSGGQRARISLARAVYARADLYLLDDVLAAVDSHVARHVFDNVIGPSGILATKGRILVTNTVSFLKHHDHLIFLRRGIILERGSYQDILADERKELHKLLMGHGNVLSGSGTSTPRADDETLVISESSEDDTAIFSTDSSLSQKMGKEDTYGKATLVETGKRVKKKDATREEHAERGRVKLSVYSAYMKAASRPGFFFFLLMTVGTYASQLLANYTLKQWGNHNQESGSNSQKWLYLGLYGLFTFSQIICTMIGLLTIFIMLGLRSAKYLHNSMLLAVMRAPLSFFELTPTGRILNLFSRDTYVVDQVLTNVIATLCRTGAQMIAILFVICLSFPAFVFVIPILSYLYYLVLVYYLATSRELKRLDATTRSPIFTSFSETLAGLSTIRAFGQQHVFMSENQRRVDRNQMCYFPSICVNRWLAVRLESLGSILIFIGANLACVALVTTGVDAGLVGLMISYGLNTTGALNWFVRCVSEVEQNIVSVERILHQTEVEPEAPDFIPDVAPHASWPSKGTVEFRGYSMRYRPELDLVLRDISLTINPKEKVGICGRTGAGKSSLLLALFRIIEPASGTIYVDGMDITTIGLHDLRSAISIIPQEPQLFEGTMRENIDPTGVAQDTQIWEALEQSHLKEYVQSLPGGLDAKVQEGGSSLSSGQRQLLCFARALLRKSKVLVLDEATSAIDLETDKAVQEILRGPQFADTTILTIAHRLNTIIGSDRVLVLNQGKVAEFDTPNALLQDPSSMFASLAREAGVTLQ